MPVPVWFPRRPGLSPPGREARPPAFKWIGGAPAGPARVQEYSTALELSGYGTFAGVNSGDTIVSVVLTVNQFTADARMGAPTYELWDFSGTPALLGQAAGTTSTSQSNID